MTWQAFIDNNEDTFRREWGIENGDKREVLAWVSYEVIYGEAPPRGSEWNEWKRRANDLCFFEALRRNR